jgi:hypothetical protein
MAIRLASRRPRRRRIGPRRRLFLDLLLLLLLTSGSLMVAVFSAGEAVREDLAGQQLRELSRRTGADFVRFFRPVEQSLRMARAWGAGGDLDLEDPTALAGRFIPLLAELPKASALVLGDSDGRSFYLSKDAEGWVARSLDTQGQGTQRRWREAGHPSRESPVSASFDPRTRLWFTGALETGGGKQVHWTRPYAFFTAGTPGVTGAISYQRPDHPGRDYVIGIDLPLRDILLAVSDLRVGNQGIAFISESDGSVLMPPARGDANRFPVSLSPDRLDAGPVFAAVRAWRDAGHPSDQPLVFDSGGAWWAWLQPLSERDNGLWLGVAVAEMEFLGALRYGWTLVLSVGALVLGTGVAIALLLTRRHGRQFAALPSFSTDPSEFKAKVLSLVRNGEGPTLEFKSTVRTNLQTGKTGKEIELAWLKGVVGFLNTDGGTLLIGVSDAGEILGIESDGFENEDKCLLHFKNLVNQHIGAEYSRYVQAQVSSVEGKTILAVSCERAEEPVFLTVGKNEEFHIRSGPSSMKLSPRQMLDYLQVSL